MATKKEKLIVIDPDKCTGCHSCEMACSIKQFGVCSPYYSRIRIYEFPDACTFIPVLCQACEDPLCIKVCPMNARMRSENGAVVTDENRCIGCRACIYACPIGAPVMNPDTGKSMSCDRCIDDDLGPWCAKACTMHALKFQYAKDATRATERTWANRLKEIYKPPGTG